MAAQQWDAVERESRANIRQTADWLRTYGDHPLGPVSMSQGENALAWHLATCPDKSRWKPAEAIRLARSATSRHPGSYPAWNTLGAALYRGGEFAESLTAINKSMQLQGGGTGFDWVLAAMALKKLNRASEAQQYRDKAIRSLVPGPTTQLENDPENRRALDRLIEEMEGLFKESAPAKPLKERKQS